MDPISDWLSAPTDAYRQWQHTEAAGADRRAFSPRSIIQHEAMFERFMRHLSAARKTTAWTPARVLRNRAIVALLLATGITAQEIRLAKAAALDLSPVRPSIEIPKRGARDARRISIVEFALPALSRWHTQLAARRTTRCLGSPCATSYSQSISACPT